jgi:hypothetical protein
MIHACYSSTNVLNEVEWHNILVQDDKFGYLTENESLIPQRAQQGLDEGWVSLLEM